MIKFSRLDTDKARAAVASLQKAKAAKESYNTPEVNAALADMFCGKPASSAECCGKRAESSSHVATLSG